MKPDLKAIVFKTPQLKETLAFFIDQLGCTIKESSPTHFVLHCEGVRILFVVTSSGPSVEFYLSRHPANGLSILEDPNQIKIIVC